MIKKILFFVLLQTYLLFAMDKPEEQYLVQTYGRTDVETISKNVLNLFPFIKDYKYARDTKDGKPIVRIALERCSFESIQTTIQIAKVVYDNYRDSQTFPESINTKTKGDIVSFFSNKKLQDQIGCINLCDHWNTPVKIIQFLCKEFVNSFQQLHVSFEFEQDDFSELVTQGYFDIVRHNNLKRLQLFFLDFKQRSNNNIKLPKLPLSDELFIPYGDLYAFFYKNLGEGKSINLYITDLTTKTISMQSQPQSLEYDETARGIETSLFGASHKNVIATTMSNNNAIMFYTLPSMHKKHEPIILTLSETKRVEGITLDSNGEQVLVLLYDFTKLTLSERYFELYAVNFPKQESKKIPVGASLENVSFLFNPRDSDTFIYYGVSKNPQGINTSALYMVYSQYDFKEKKHTYIQERIYDTNDLILNVKYNALGDCIFVLMEDPNGLRCRKYRYGKYQDEIIYDTNQDNIFSTSYRITDIQSTDSGNCVFIEYYHKNQGKYALIEFDFRNNKSWLLHQLQVGRYDIAILDELVVFRDTESLGISKNFFYDSIFSQGYILPTNPSTILGFSSNNELWLRSHKDLSCFSIYQHCFNQCMELLEQQPLTVDMLIAHLNLFSSQERNMQTWYASCLETLESTSVGITAIINMCTQKNTSIEQVAAKLQAFRNRKKGEAEDMQPSQPSMPSEQPQVQVGHIQQPVVQPNIGLQRQPAPQVQQVVQPVVQQQQPQLPQPKPNFIQRVWSRVQGAVDWITINMVVPLFRWLGFIA